MSGSDAATAAWYADGLRFLCANCGQCCSGAPGYVWVESEETERIAAHLGLTSKEFHRKHVRRVGWGLSLLEKADGDCEFLKRSADGKTRCLIHAVRPVQCGTWPFWKSNVTSLETWALTASDCPGIDQGQLHACAAIDEALKANGRRPL